MEESGSINGVGSRSRCSALKIVELALLWVAYHCDVCVPKIVEVLMVWVADHSVID